MKMRKRVRASENLKTTHAHIKKKNSFFLAQKIKKQWAEDRSVDLLYRIYKIILHTKSIQVLQKKILGKNS